MSPLTNKCLTPYRADFTICLNTNSKHKSQGCAHFTRKSYAMPAKIPETPPETSGLLKHQ